MDEKRRMVTKYVTEAFGLLLLTDSFNGPDHLPVGRHLGCVPSAPGLGGTLPLTKLENSLSIILLFIPNKDPKLRECKENRKMI